MPSGTLNMCHSSHFDALFPSQNQQNVKFLPFWFFRHCFCRDLRQVLKFLQNQQNVKFHILIFQELLIIETWNKCHWIWHTSNPKYVPLKPFWCIFPSQNQQNVKFLPEILIFRELLIVETWNLCHWIWHTSNPKYMPLKPFWCIFPSQNQQNVKFLAVHLTPPTKNENNVNLCRERCLKDLKICTYRFLDMPITMHYVRTLCDKYFLRYYGFPWYLIGRFRHRVLKHGVGVEWDPRRTTA